MKEALRVGIAVTAGVLLWGLLWNLGTAGLADIFPADLAGVERIESTSLLLLMAAYSALLSSAVGWLAARIGGESAFIATLVLSVVNLAIGSLVQTIYWAMMPLWYHLPVPGTDPARNPARRAPGHHIRRCARAALP